MRLISIPTLLFLSMGCASYRYDLTQPAMYAGALGQPRSFALEPLRYTVGSAEDRLSIQVDNPTGDTVRLSGRESYVVDPDHRSHPLIDQTIAPQAFVRVVLPPLRPWAGTNSYVGDSASYGGRVAEDQRAYGTSLGGGAWTDPGYDRASPVYWDWPGTGDVRVHLVYRRANGSAFAHDLAVTRRNS